MHVQAPTSSFVTWWKICQGRDHTLSPKTHRQHSTRAVPLPGAGGGIRRCRSAEKIPALDKLNLPWAMRGQTPAPFKALGTPDAKSAGLPDSPQVHMLHPSQTLKMPGDGARLHRQVKPWRPAPSQGRVTEVLVSGATDFRSLKTKFQILRIGRAKQTLSIRPSTGGPTGPFKSIAIYT